MSTLTATEPRFRYVPTFSSSAGQDCIDFAAEAGLVLDPWQREVVIAALGEKDTGGWTATEVDLLVPRQNGKGGILEAVEIFFLFVVGECRLITHTAHRFDTCLDHFRRVKLLIEETPDLLEKVYDKGRRRADGLPPGIKDSNGSESITLKDRSVLQFKARERGSGRGFPGDMVVFDEAFQLGELTGLVSSMSASAGDPQVWFTSSHPLPGSASDSLRKIMRTGRALATDGGEKKKVYIEYGCDDAADLDDPESLTRANPGFECGRLNADILEVERDLYTVEELKRERFGIVPMPDESEVAWELFDEAAWDAGKVEAGDWLDGPYTYAVEVTPARDRYAISAAGMHGDRVGVECGSFGPYDEDTVLGVLVGLHSKGWKALLVDPKSPAATLIRPLKQLHGIDVHEVTVAQYAEACQSFYDAHRGDLAHSDHDPSLDGAVAAAKKKQYSGGWLFDRTVRDMTPLSSAALARWGHLEIEEPPPRSVYEDRAPITL